MPSGWPGWSPGARRSSPDSAPTTARAPVRSASPAIRGAGPASLRSRASSASSTRGAGAKRNPSQSTEHLAYLEEVIQYEGPQTIAAFILETVTGTNGILIPPDGYLQGVRELCTKYGILMIADEVMAGFGRTGRWFAVDHWDVVPDLITMAKGLTSSYLPLGAVAMSPPASRLLRRPRLLRRAHVLGPSDELCRGHRGDRRPSRRRSRRQRRAPRSGPPGPAARAPGEASQRRGRPQHRPLRDHRARPRPRHTSASSPGTT